ncbi:hypothetical protein ACJ6WD_35465 [Streptomyces sp. VTCC 41912]|uniref:hypothetical protein n=1 Tax=Streptomyces sp. VTCC 41912 TaxID=3383243 RepID=UPI003896BDD2
MSRLTLEGLEDQLDELVMLVSAVAEDGMERSDRLGKAVGQLREQLQEVVDQLAAAEAEDVGDEEPPHPASWTDRAAPEEWAALADWVDWLQGHYEISGDLRVLPCWPHHKGAVDELAALHGSWKAAMLADHKSKGVGDAAVYWHDRYLDESLRRACRRINRSCLNGHTAPKPVATTDRGALPPVTESSPVAQPE